MQDECSWPRKTTEPATQNRWYLPIIAYPVWILSKNCVCAVLELDHIPIIPPFSCLPFPCPFPSPFLDAFVLSHVVHLEVPPP